MPRPPGEMLRNTVSWGLHALNENYTLRWKQLREEDINPTKEYLLAQRLMGKTPSIGWHGMDEKGNTYIFSGTEWLLVQQLGDGKYCLKESL